MYIGRASDTKGRGTDGQGRQSGDPRGARSAQRARKPYYRRIEEGLHLGYRKPRGRRGKPAGAGKWVARHYVGRQAYTIKRTLYTIETIGIADDLSDADSVASLSFWHAQQKARERMARRLHDANGILGPLTIKGAIDRYLDALENGGKSVVDSRHRAKAHIHPVARHRGNAMEDLGRDLRRLGGRDE